MNALGASLTFFATASVLLLGLLAAHRIRPGWFGLASARSAAERSVLRTGQEPSPTLQRQPETTPAAFSPRPDASGVDRGAPRPVVARMPSSASLPSRIFADGVASVVHVTAKIAGVDAVARAGRFGQWDEDLEDVVLGTGSGLIWDTEGHIVTCRHVLEKATAALVTFSDGTIHDAKLVGMSEEHDLAVLRVDALPEKLLPIRVGTSQDLTVGMKVFSVACPYGLGHSLSIGTISGLNRQIQSTSGALLKGTIQTDVGLHAGSSGGALIDDQGRVIAMIAAIYLGSRRRAGVGFAQPIARLQEVVPMLIEQGYRWSPRFGFLVLGDADSAQLLGDLHTPAAAPAKGVVVAEIYQGGSAERAQLRGMRLGRTPTGLVGHIVRDIIVAAEGKAVTSRRDLFGVIDNLPPGAPLHLTVARPGGTVALELSPEG